MNLDSIRGARLGAFLRQALKLAPKVASALRLSFQKQSSTWCAPRICFPVVNLLLVVLFPDAARPVFAPTTALLPWINHASDAQTQTAHFDDADDNYERPVKHRRTLRQH